MTIYKCPYCEWVMREPNIAEWPALGRVSRHTMWPLQHSSGSKSITVAVA